MTDDDVDMDQFLCFNREQECSQGAEDKYFNRERTLKLLDLYKIYKKKLGTFEVKSMKKLWELVARDLSNEYRLTIASSKCENRFKVLERNYKKVIDNDSKTGRGRIKKFEFQEEMDDIFQKKRNIHPVMLLSSDASRKTTPPELSSSIPSISILEDQEQATNPQPSCSHQNPSEGHKNNPSSSAPENHMKSSSKRKRPTPAYRKRNNILVDMRNDLRSFYEKKEKREQEKLEISKKRLEEKQKHNEILKEYVEVLKSQNNDK